MQKHSCESCEDVLHAENKRTIAGLPRHSRSSWAIKVIFISAVSCELSRPPVCSCFATKVMRLFVINKLLSVGVCELTHAGQWRRSTECEKAVKLCDSAKTHTSGEEMTNCLWKFRLILMSEISHLIYDVHNRCTQVSHEKSNILADFSVEALNKSLEATKKSIHITIAKHKNTNATERIRMRKKKIATIMTSDFRSTSSMFLLPFSWLCFCCCLVFQFIFFSPLQQHCRSCSAEKRKKGNFPQRYSGVGS